jgi:hypothetical protein
LENGEQRLALQSHQSAPEIPEFTGLRLRRASWSEDLGLHRVIASDFMDQHPAFDRYQESYPRRSELHQNYFRVPVMNKVQFLLASEPRKPLKPRIPLRDIPCQKRHARKTTPHLRLPSPRKTLAAIRNKRTARLETQE